MRAEDRGRFDVNKLKHPLISPFYADYANVSEPLPVDRIHVIYGEKEVFRDQIRLFIQKLKSANVYRKTVGLSTDLEVTFQEAPDMVHIFLFFFPLIEPRRLWPQAQESFNFLEGFINGMEEANCDPLLLH